MGNLLEKVKEIRVKRKQIVSFDTPGLNNEVVQTTGLYIRQSKCSYFEVYTKTGDVYRVTLECALALNRVNHLLKDAKIARLVVATNFHLSSTKNTRWVVCDTCNNMTIADLAYFCVGDVDCRYYARDTSDFLNHAYTVYAPIRDRLRIIKNEIMSIQNSYIFSQVAYKQQFYENFNTEAEKILHNLQDTKSRQLKDEPEDTPEDTSEDEDRFYEFSLLDNLLSRVPRNQRWNQVI